MAGKINNTWFIWVLLIVAGVFVVMAFSKEKPKLQPITAQTEDVATLPVVVAVDVQTIKPAHTQPAQTGTLKPKAAAAIVIPPQEIPQHVTLAVQVYSFKEKTRAEAALNNIKNKGYNAYIMVSDLGARGIWYRVRVGTFNNETDAKKALERVSKDFKSGIIVTE